MLLSQRDQVRHTTYISYAGASTQTCSGKMQHLVYILHICKYVGKKMFFVFLIKLKKN